MTYARRSLARFALVLGAVAWVAGWGATLVHHINTVHVTCEVHGDEVDVGHPSATAEHRDQDVASSLDAVDDHDHDCAFHAVGVARVHRFVASVAFVQAVHRQDDPVPAIRAPRGPPLAYAPKTSPPVPA